MQILLFRWYTFIFSGLPVESPRNFNFCGVLFTETVEIYGILNDIKNIWGYKMGK